jgi:hypothetical protein
VYHHVGTSRDILKPMESMAQIPWCHVISVQVPCNIGHMSFEQIEPGQNKKNLQLRKLHSKSLSSYHLILTIPKTLFTPSFHIVKKLMPERCETCGSIMIGSTKMHSDRRVIANFFLTERINITCWYGVNS